MVMIVVGREVVGGSVGAGTAELGRRRYPPAAALRSISQSFACTAAAVTVTSLRSSGG